MAQYHPLEQIDLNQTPEHGEDHNSHRWRPRIRDTIVFLLALYGLLNLATLLWSHLPTLKRAHLPCSCGQSPEEAITRGCKFDPFALAWLPDNCRDDELIREFEELGKAHNHSWEFYTWPNPERKLDLSQVSMMAQVVGVKHINRSAVTTTVDWHHTHCLYLWRKLYRSRYTKLRMESRYDAEHHQKHCVESILNWIRLQSPAEQLLGGSVIDLYSENAPIST
ncbi:hypothetical protein ETB97_001425 [Aspergillus alliaceus]|uniref:Uncharacterized protein n=1 Tax=Petromyces alliaceus TaxID=209559 RepID=A0A5N6FXZ4_PETAA|nr:uncharacterized protein BDW43DRAFT_274573 [Aspergillus alliaceus]KAB8234229.1 hypothetical protein BDW43DRAFT_274573 [Aspergillus alliaceus]KAF5860525.1 hypothetical protein ETB97_001425 [Aspergillus burnettii]